MKILIVIIMALPLMSLAPVPAPVPAVYTARITIVQSAMLQGCTFETATSRLRQEISDPIGYPYGFVQAWSCSGDGLAVASELAQRASDMQAQAAAYRAAHPIAP